MTERIELFSLWLKEWNLLFFWIWRKELNSFLFECDSKNWTFFFEWDQKIWTFSEKNLTHRNWDLLFNMTHRNWEPFLKLWLKELNLFLFKKIWPKEWNSFSKNDSKNWIFFWNMTHTIEPLVMNLFFNMTQRIELFCFLDLIFTVWLREFNFWKKKKHIDAKNWTLLLEYDAKNWTLFKNTTQRIELFFSKENDSKNWTFFFSNTTQRIEFF